MYYINLYINYPMTHKFYIQRNKNLYENFLKNLKLKYIFVYKYQI